MAGAYDDLYSHYGGNGHSWYDKINQPARDWLDGLADDIRERGSEPNWAAAYRAFLEAFPDHAPDTDTTVRTTVRKLVKQRG